MNAPARHLHLVLDTETGVTTEVDECPGCRDLQDKLRGAERDINAWRARYANLERDKEAEARAHDLWPTVVKIVKVWRVLCRHPRSSVGAVEFGLIRVILQDPQYGKDVPERMVLCLRAVAGASFDAFETKRKNGSTKRHDGLDLIFRSREKFQEMVNRAPSNWRELLPEGSLPCPSN